MSNAFDFNVELMKKELIRDEGLRQVPYKDSVGLWTIGVGHLILGKDGKPETNVANLPKFWSREKCLAVLEEDMWKHYAPIKDKDWYKALDTDNRRRAMTNMSFNLGSRLFLFKNTLAYLAKKQWGLAANNLIQSKWFTQVGQRASRIVGLIRNG